MPKGTILAQKKQGPKIKRKRQNTRESNPFRPVQAVTPPGPARARPAKQLSGLAFPGERPACLMAWVEGLSARPGSFSPLSARGLVPPGSSGDCFAGIGDASARVGEPFARVGEASARPGDLFTETGEPFV